MVENRETFAGEDRQRDKELLEDQSAKASQASEMRREQPAIPGHDALRVDAPVGRADPGCRIQGSTHVPPRIFLERPDIRRQGGPHGRARVGLEGPELHARDVVGNLVGLLLRSPSFSSFRTHRVLQSAGRLDGQARERSWAFGLGYTGSRGYHEQRVIIGRRGFVG